MCCLLRVTSNIITAPNVTGKRTYNIPRLSKYCLELTNIKLVAAATIFEDHTFKGLPGGCKVFVKFMAVIDKDTAKEALSQNKESNTF